MGERARGPFCSPSRSQAFPRVDHKSEGGLEGQGLKLYGCWRCVVIAA